MPRTATPNTVSPIVSPTTSVEPVTFGSLLRTYRRRRALSQEQLAGDADVSTRHLSFLETNKARPSRDMVLDLAAALGLELRERNTLLEAAGFARAFSDSPLSSLHLAPVRRAVDLLFRQQEPFTSMLLDRDWNIVDMNDGARRLVAHFVRAMPDDPAVLQNIVRAILHPQGLKPSIANWPHLAAYTVERLRFECVHEATPGRLALLEEVLRYPDVDALPAYGLDDPVVLVHLRRIDDDGVVTEAKLFTMITTLGTPLDVTAQELAVESTFPADEETEHFLRDLAAAWSTP